MEKIHTRLLVFFIILTIIGLIALGNWQVRRLDWKVELIEKIENRAYSAATLAPSQDLWTTITAQDHEYLRVSTRGTYNHEQETLVWTATDYGSGYWVITPLTNSENQTILINRGFIPFEYAEQQTRSDGLITGQTEITGLLRMSEPKGTLLRKNDPANNQWYSRDLEQIAKAHGLGNVAPYFIDADALNNENMLPIGGLTKLNFHNFHLFYAITWYGLAGLLALLTWRAKKHMSKKHN